MLSKQAHKTPNRIALKFSDSELTYQQLEEESNRFANYLLDIGITKGQNIGIYIKRSIEQIIAIIGVLKAGAVYVPLESDHPRKRLDYIIDKSTIRYIIVKDSNHPFTDNKAFIPIDLGTLQPNLLDYEKHLPKIDIAPEEAAYIIYTSGSTGQPKGVVIQHKAIVNFVNYAKKYYELKDSDRVLQFASFSFDASLEEVFPTLTCGATLVLRTEEMISSTRLFFEKCLVWGITVLDLPTAYWNEVITEIKADDIDLPESLRLVIIGGEKASFKHVDEWIKQTRGRIQLVNSYGPTEATIVSTVERFKDESDLAGLNEIPIGKSIDNSQTLILDETLEAVPIGVTGELFIGGRGLALGYLKEPKLTAEAFVPNPFDNRFGERIYRTGDLARYLNDGRIEIFGRKDEQVKIRGYRIEISEVRKAITSNNHIKEAIVIPEEFNNTRRLVAYFTCKDEEALSNSDLRDYLTKSIPSYMVPSRLTRLSEIPLNPNGKIDTKALSDLQNEDDSIEVFQLPISQTEKTLAIIWSEILQLEKVGRNQNFFSLGGHSLLGTRVISHIQKNFGVSLPLKSLFETADLAGLAKKIDNSQTTQNRIDLPEIKNTDNEQVRLSFAQERLWFLQLLSPETTAYNVFASYQI